MNKINFFCGDYRDGRVYIKGRSYAAGTFAVHLLNQYYKDDTAARIVVFGHDNYLLERAIKAGYFDIDDFVKAGEGIELKFKALARLKPFDMLGIEAEQKRVSELFSEETGKVLLEYLHNKREVMQRAESGIPASYIAGMYNQKYFDDCYNLLNQVLTTLRFYDQLGTDIRVAFENLRKFVKSVYDADKFDEAHLLPIALSVFGSKPFPVTTEYVSVKKSSRAETTARRLYFENYYSFIITDFFEGLHYGHYPRQCEICGRYFLMTSAVRQKYCNGYAPFKVKGKAITCRKYAARINRKELAEGNPVIRIYKNRCSAIRVERSRNKITDEFAQKALALAKVLMQKARTDTEYANGQYAKDMSKDILYSKIKQ